jgi:putative SOS response-associated peptidase YedK
MCGRYGRRADKQRIAEWFHTHNTDVFNDEYYEINSTRLAPSYNISPESIQPVVRQCVSKSLKRALRASVQ